MKISDASEPRSIDSRKLENKERASRALKISLLAISALIALGSLVALIFKPSPAKAGGEPARAPEYMTILDADRIPLLEGGLAVVTLKAGIPAQRDQEGDRAFREELGKQAQALKDSARFYLSGRPASELKDLMVRDALKASVLGLLNRSLVLGAFSRVVALEIDVID
jgi:flagellar basal body-associated protein FliL